MSLLVCVSVSILSGIVPLMACHPHLKDVARRGEPHLWHGWHFNLSPLPALFPSIVHQCIRTNAMGNKGISVFDSIDGHLWLRLHCCGCRGMVVWPIGVSEEEIKERWRGKQRKNRKVKSLKIMNITESKRTTCKLQQVTVSHLKLSYKKGSLKSLSGVNISKFIEFFSVVPSST